MAGKTPEEMAQTMIDNLPDKTGKSLEAWHKLLGKAKLQKHGEIVKHLKADHGVTHGFANLIAQLYLREREITGRANGDLVANQYSGAKADLKPIYDALVTKVQKFGKDVDVSPKKTYVSLRRHKQFALIQPSTKTRIDVGINLKGTPANGRLENSGSFNAMVSHRVRLADKKDINAELIGWLKKAYQSA